MANDLTVIVDKILARSLMSLRQRVVMPRLVNSDYGSEAARFGATIDIPIPVAQSATAVTPGQVPPAPGSNTPTQVQVSLDQWYYTDFHMTDKEMLEVNASATYLPMQTGEALKALSNKINQNIWSHYTGVFGWTGTAGTTPFATDTSAAVGARKILNEQLCPPDDRSAVIDLSAEANALSLSPFADAEKTGESGVKINGEIGRKYGFQWYYDNHVPSHTAGTITTGLAAKAATAQGVGDTSIIATTAASTGACALVAGDVIEISGQGTGKTFVVTSAATQASANSDVTVNIYPGLYVALAGGETITVKGNHTVNLAFHRDAFAFAMRPLESTQLLADLGGAIVRSMTDHVTGLSIRLQVSRQWMQTAWVFDALWGAKCVRPELACRIAG